MLLCGFHADARGEQEPLIARDVEDGGEDDRTPPGKVYKFLFYFFYFLCTITGQLPIRPARADGDQQPSDGVDGQPPARPADGVGGDHGQPPARPADGVGGDHGQPPARPADVGGDHGQPPARPADDHGQPPARPAEVNGDQPRVHVRNGDGGRVQTKYKRCLALVYVAGVLTSFVLLFFFTTVNLVSLGFDLYIITVCPYKRCGYLSIPIIDVNASGLQAVQPVNLTIFDDWQKTVITTATFSGTASYLFMAWVSIVF